MDLTDILKQIETLPPEKQREMLSLVDRLEKQNARERAKSSFMGFVRAVWPDFIDGRHHKIMAEAFDRIKDGKLKRLIVCMPPRHTKSEFSSYLLPAYFLGHHPKKKIIQASHTAELAVGFGRKVRNLMDTEDYQNIFPKVNIAGDAKAAGRWATSYGGEYFAVGVGGAVAGRGADLLVIDDPISEQEAIMAQTNPEILDKVYDWYLAGPRQRLQPGGAIAVIMTRWHQKDLVGQILKRQSALDGVDQWEVIEFPAIMPSGQPLWPEFWSLAALTAIKNELPIGKWNAQYMQNPTSEEGALIKRDWWKKWEPKRLPECESILQSWDTAFLKTERADYSACTTWGVFYPEDSEKKVPHLILLDAYKEKLEFPDLKRKALNLYKEWKPDMFLIESKAAGSPLIFELRAMGIPVSEFNPSRGQDKIARVNAITDIFASGRVWYPESKWAEEVIEECAAFPYGDHDDFVDTCLAAGTKVITDKGLKNIEEISVGDRVLTHIGRFRPVTATGFREADHYLNLSGRCLDSIRVTPEHPIHVSRMKYKNNSSNIYFHKTEFVSAGSLVPRSRYTFMRDAKVVNSYQAAPHDAIRIPTPLSLLDVIDVANYVDKRVLIDENYLKTRKNKTNRFVNLDEDFGYLCGLFAAEGCVFNKRGRPSGISIACDFDALQKCKLIVENVFGIKAIVRRGFGCHVITFNSIPMANLFSTFGRLSECKIIPDWALMSTPEFSAGFINGYGHGDGYQDRGSLRITSTSLSLLWGVRLLGQKIGLLGKIHVSKKAAQRNVLGKICKCLDVWTITFSKNGIGQMDNLGAAFFVSQKQDVSEKILVYNLSVEEDESYCTTGGAVHNCSQALIRLRQGGWIGADEDDEDDEVSYVRRADYY